MSEEEITEPVETANSDDGASDNLSAEELPDNTFNEPWMKDLPNELQDDPQLTGLADALKALPEAERPAIIEHVKALARLSSAKRTAVLTLAADDG